jgi:hypothetical protein
MDWFRGLLAEKGRRFQIIVFLSQRCVTPAASMR